VTPLATIGPLPFSWWNVVLVATQALLVALPAAGLPPFARRFAGRSWSLVLPLSISVVVAVLAVLPGAAVGLTWLALVATPPLAAAALGWGAHGARPWLAVLAVPALVLAIVAEGERLGQAGALFITALSCVALGRLLVGAVGAGGDDDATRAADGHATRPSGASSGGPPGTGARSSLGRGAVPGRAAASSALARSREVVLGIARALPPTAWIRIALVAMAVIDAVLVFSGGLERPNRALNAAVPAAELPRLQFVQFGFASMGYGDVFVAGVLGALLAAEGASRRTQWAAAVVTFGLSLVFDLLFWVVDVLPATVPVAVALLLFGGLRGPGRAPPRPEAPSSSPGAPRGDVVAAD
jgi:hypothetical protein